MKTEEYMNKPFSVGSVSRGRIMETFAEDDEDIEAIRLMVEDLDEDIMMEIAHNLGWYGVGDYFYDNLRDIFDSVGRTEERLLYYKNKLESGVNNG